MFKLVRYCDCQIIECFPVRSLIFWRITNSEVRCLVDSSRSTFCEDHLSILRQTTSRMLCTICIVIFNGIFNVNSFKHAPKGVVRFACTCMLTIGKRLQTSVQNVCKNKSSKPVKSEFQFPLKMPLKIAFSPTFCKFTSFAELGILFPFLYYDCIHKQMPVTP